MMELPFTMAFAINGVLWGLLFATTASAVYVSVPA